MGQEVFVKENEARRDGHPREGSDNGNDGGRETEEGETMVLCCVCCCWCSGVGGREEGVG